MPQKYVPHEWKATTLSKTENEGISRDLFKCKPYPARIYGS